MTCLAPAYPKDDNILVAKPAPSDSDDSLGSPLFQVYHIQKLGVKANVLFFDARPARGQPWTDKLWVYDLRTNMHFTLKTRPLKRRDLDEFVACFQAPNGGSRWFESSAAHSDVPSYAGP
jgi:hypothetical protein